MTFRKLSALSFVSVFIFSGCATMSPIVTLKPVAPTTSPSIKNAPSIVLTVTDKRVDTSFGTLPTGPNEKPLHTQAAIPVEQVVRTAVTESLTRSGFTVLSAPDENAPQLTVEIQKLDFKLDQWGGSSEIKGMGELSIIAKAGTTTRTKTYKAENGKKWVLNPPVNGHEQYLNELLTDLLNAFLTDEAFLSSLTSK